MFEVITMRTTVIYTMSIWDGDHHLPCLFFREVIIHYSLNNSVSFEDTTLEITSKDCVSVRVELYKALALEREKERCPVRKQ